MEKGRGGGESPSPLVSNFQGSTLYLNESGLYSLIFGSKLESAKVFKRWVTKDVLPSIRKTGRYDYYIDHKYNNTLTFKICLTKNPFKDEVAQEPAKRIKPTPPPRTGNEESERERERESVKPKPISRKSVNEDGYKPIPKPRTDRPLQIPKIKELNRALKGHAKSYEIQLQDNLNPLNHFTKTRPQTESQLDDLLKTMKGFKFIETLEVTFEKDTIDSKTGKRVSIYKTAFFNGKAKTITKPNDIEQELNMSRQEILNTIDKWVSEGSGWVIDRIDSHYINVTTYKPLHGSSYMELPTELRNPKKGLINIKKEDDECFRWCHIRHLNPQFLFIYLNPQKHIQVPHPFFSRRVQR